jgi:hypothetical protein
MKLDREVVRIGRLSAWSDGDAKRVVGAWRKSGESRAAFGRRYGIPVHRLYYWIGRQEAVDNDRSAKRVKFHPIEVVRADPQPQAPIEIRLIRVPRGVELEELRTVLSALESQG